MAKIQLTVPTLAQEKPMCCWHTSAMMIWQWSQKETGRQGPMNTVAPTYKADTGLTPQEFITLAKTVGLKALARKNTYSTDDLAGYLKTHGPLWCAGFWYGFGHIVVLTGIDGGTVYINDPDGGTKKTGSLSWFNEKLASQIDGCLMHKDSSRY